MIYACSALAPPRTAHVPARVFAFCLLKMLRLIDAALYKQPIPTLPPPALPTPLALAIPLAFCNKFGKSANCEHNRQNVAPSWPASPASPAYPVVILILVRNLLRLPFVCVCVCRGVCARQCVPGCVCVFKCVSFFNGLNNL